MKRWGLAFVLLIGCCIAVLMQRSSNPSMLQDSDTRGLLAGIVQRDAPLSWFTTDWPIENHFYRPVSTLTLEADYRLYGTQNAAGFGLTNALLCMLSIVSLFWLTRELTDKPLITALTTVIFSLWQLDCASVYWLSSVLSYTLWLIPLALYFRNRDYKQVIGAMLIIGFLVVEIRGKSNLFSGTIAWIPGRTATSMAVFALASLAAYARYERLGRFTPKPLEAIDLPSTKSSKHTTSPNKWNVAWAIAACLFLALALCCYEQAVMVPSLLVGVGIWMSILRRRVRWAWQVAFWGILVGYILVRHAVIPPGSSQYQNQQFKSGLGALQEVGDWLLPSWYRVRDLINVVNPDLFILIVPNLIFMIWGVASNLQTYYAMYRKLPVAFGAWAMSFLAYLPMAWLHRFDHYYYFPMALRAIFVTGLLAITYEWVVSAYSPRSIQAPLRFDPAPGSLPHR